MKSDLQKDAFKTGLLIWTSMALIIAGISMFYTVSGNGALLVVIGVAGLCYSLSRM